MSRLAEKTRWQTVVSFVAVPLVIGVAWLAYRNALTVPFLFDDHSAVLHNPTIRDLARLDQVLAPPPYATGVIGRPLLNLSLAMNHAVGGYAPAGYHVVNVLIHGFCALLLMGIVRCCLASPVLQARYGADAGMIGLCTAVLWTVHPLLTESVTCIIQRSEVLGGFFCLLSLYAFLKGIDPMAPALWRVLAVLAALLGTQAKEIIVAVPVIALAFDRVLFAGSFLEAWRRRRAVYVGYLMCWILLGWVIVNQGARGQSVGFGLGVSSWDYLLTQAVAITRYLRLSFWPHPLVLDYGAPLAAGLSEVWAEMLLIASLAALTLAGVWRGVAWALPGIWFFAILAPSSSVVPLATQTIAEHRMYLPLAAVVVNVLLLLHRFCRARWAVASVVGLLALGLAHTTWQRNEQYQTSIGIWTDTVTKMPENTRAQINLGRALEIDGRLPEAAAHYSEALRLKAVSHEAHYNLANILAKTGDFDGAARHYRESLQLRPAQPSAHNNLGLVLSQLRQPNAAMASFAEAVRLDPAHTGARFNWALELLRQRRMAQAEEQMKECVALKPDNARYRMIYGEVLLAQSRAEEAISQLEAARELQPDLPGLEPLLRLARRSVPLAAAAGIKP